MSPGNGLIEAVVALLRADPDVQARFGEPARIFDTAPPGASFPHAAVSALSAQAWNAGGERGADMRLAIDVRTRGKSRADAARAAGVIEAALDDAALILPGGRLTGIFFRAAQMQTEKDNETYRTRLEFRALIEEEL